VLDKEVQEGTGCGIAVVVDVAEELSRDDRLGFSQVL
jgi:hypothetical protein